MGDGDAMSTVISAVRTTGIYCRAGCAARPLERNVTHYHAAVAAEAAGYRACLKCRPDREAPWVAPESMPDPLRRALLLISDGLLDVETEATLSNMVGFSPRHLRRLFYVHVGATPSFVAQSRRAHFARSLLDDTTLSVTDVAFASGFSSVRQMNRVVKDIFRFTPTELRSRRRGHPPDSADGGLVLQLPLAAPTDAAEIIAFLEPRCTPGVESVESGVYRRTLELCGYAGAIEIKPAGQDQLSVTAHLPTYAGLVDVVARITRMFGSDTDHNAALAHLSADPLLGSSVKAAPGRRIPGAWSSFESAVRIVIGQQVTVAGASTLTGRVVEAAGRRVEGLARIGLSHLFPTAEEILVADLGGIGLTTRRVTTLQHLAQSVVSGTVDFAARPQELRLSLLDQPGIGPWTAELIATRVGRDADAFACSDLGIRRGASGLLGSDLLSPHDVEAMSQAWRPHRALAAAHLWHTC